jgi:hypothetical protein
MQGVSAPSRRPKRLSTKKWGEPQLDLTLQIRTENPNYDKPKISTILRRDHGLNMSEIMSLPQPIIFALPAFWPQFLIFLESMLDISIMFSKKIMSQS